MTAGRWSNPHDPHTACAALGTLLGLERSRADKTDGTGPDVLWRGEGNIAAFELKTGKQPSSEYDKRDIGQVHDHAQWVERKFGAAAVRHAIVGHLLKVSSLANPSPSLRVIELEQFVDLASRVEAVFQAVDADDKSNIDESFQRWLQYQGLIWPTCVDSLANRLAIDLRKDL